MPDLCSRAITSTCPSPRCRTCTHQQQKQVLLYRQCHPLLLQLFEYCFWIFICIHQNVVWSCVTITPSPNAVSRRDPPSALQQSCTASIFHEGIISIHFGLVPSLLQSSNTSSVFSHWPSHAKCIHQGRLSAAGKLAPYFISLKITISNIGCSAWSCKRCRSRGPKIAIHWNPCKQDIYRCTIKPPNERPINEGGKEISFQVKSAISPVCL